LPDFFLQGIEVFTLENFREIIQFLNGELSCQPLVTDINKIFANVNIKAA